MGNSAGRLLLMATPSLSDQHLLGIIARRVDDSAFTELVRRHGPLVFGVCRRVLNHDQDAEDAFQATFLVLAKRATSISNRQSLGAWLFGVARRVALRLREKNRCRDKHERESASLPATSLTNPDHAGWLAVLEEELYRLPEKYKSPLIACHIQGRTQEETARELKLSQSTLRRRLEHAKELLRNKLTKRGVGTSIVQAGLVGLMLDVRLGLAEETKQSAKAFILGERATAPAALAHGAMTTMSLVKIKLITGIAIAITVSISVWYSAFGSPQGDRDGQGQTIVKPLSDAGQKVIQPATPPAQEQKSSDDRIKPGDRLAIVIRGGLPGVTDSGLYLVEASGKIALYPEYGDRIDISGKTLEEAETALVNHLKKEVGLKNPLVRVTRGVPAIDENRLAALEDRIKSLEARVAKLEVENIALKKK